MAGDLPKHILIELYEKCSTIKQAMLWARRSGYRFTDAHFRAEWRALAGKREMGDTPSLLPTPARPASPLGRLAGIQQEDELTDEKEPVAAGVVKAQDAYRGTLRGQRFVFTCAQNNTLVHEGFFKSLVQFCKARDAKLAVSRTTYNIAAWNKRVGNITKKLKTAEDDFWYDERLKPYFLDDQVKVADGLVFCGELDILPTMQNPLNGLDNYTGTNSAIIPHVKMHMRSLATMKHEDAKFLYTTGTVTLRNYINRRIGQIASFNHVYGALYVEIDENGEWFVRQLNADDNGTFFDLNDWFTPGGQAAPELLADHAAFVNLGDIHAEKLDPVAWRATQDMLRYLKPSRVFIHDIADFTARNHHNTSDPWFLAEMGNRRVEDDIRAAAAFLYDLRQVVGEGCTLHVVQSNHDDALTKWLKTQTPIEDAGNKWYWHQLNAWAYRAISRGEPVNIFERAMQRAWNDLYGPLEKFAYFVKKDESIVLRDIEFGMHGHLGPNGARGNPVAFRQIGRRANTGHTHSAGIIDGVWTAGVLATLDMGYNAGPSSWSHSHIVTYPNGKRTIVTIKKGKWHA